MNDRRHSGKRNDDLGDKKRWVARIGLLSFAVLTGVFIGEIAARISGKAPEIKPISFDQSDCVYKRSTNPVLGFELKSNYTNSNPDFIQSYERTNNHGQRDQERSIEKPKGTKRILVLGDSVVEGHGLPEESTITAYWENALAESNTEILNFGVSAYCTLAEIELLEVKGLRFDPDIVVLVFVENDFDNFNREAFPLQGTLLRPAWANGLFQSSHLFRIAALQWNWFHFGLEFDPVVWNVRAIGENNVVKGLKRFRSLADQHSFQPLVAIWPRFYENRVGNFPLLPHTNEVPIIEYLAAMQNLPTVRLSPYFQKALMESEESNNPRLLFSQGDELHPSKYGAKIAAKALHDSVQRLIQGESKVKSKVLNHHHPDIGTLMEKLGAEVPNYARVYHREGVNHLKNGQIEKALSAFQKTLEEDPEHAGAHYNMGLAFESLGKTNQAHQAWEKAVDLDPDFSLAHFKLAKSFLQQNNSNQAVDSLEKVLQIDPHHVSALNLLGMEMGKARQFQKAITYLNEAIVLEPDFSPAHNNLGVVAAMQGDLEKALKHFQTAVKTDPDNQEALARTQTIRSMLESKKSP